jgi:hypothetical protein
MQPRIDGSIFYILFEDVPEAQRDAFRRYCHGKTGPIVNNQTAYFWDDWVLFTRMDAALVIPPDQEPLPTNELLAIAEVTEDDVNQAVAAWKKNAPEGYESILEAEPEN